MVKQPDGRMVFPQRWIKIWKEMKAKEHDKEICSDNKPLKGPNVKMVKSDNRS